MPHINTFRQYKGYVGQFCPADWHLRSPYLNPLDFFFRKYLKKTGYHTEEQNVGKLHERIITTRTV